MIIFARQRRMQQELSILIPTYNGDCREQVTELSRQAELIDGLHYEIIVADDGSTDVAVVEANRSVISQLPHARYLLRGFNAGRAAIRNLLVEQSQYRLLLFIDCEMAICRNDFLHTYLCEADKAPVVYGGYTVGDGPARNLRYQYEKRSEPLHTADKRRLAPYKDFHTANFMAKREVLLATPFDTRFKKYGYEDVLLGKQLRKKGIAIHHIDNPVGFCKFDDNAEFIRKTEESLVSLHEFRHDLRGYSQLLTFVDGIHLPIIKWLLRLWHRLAGPAERRILCGKHSSLQLLKIYKLGYFLCLDD